MADDKNKIETISIIRDARNAEDALKKVSSEMLKYTNDFTKIPKNLSKSFVDAEKKAKSYFDRLNRESHNLLRNFIPGKSQSSISIDDTRDLLRQINNLQRGYNQTNVNAQNIKNKINQISEQVKFQKESAEALKTNTRYERAEAVGYLLDTFNQGFSQAMSAAESKYRMLASDAYSQGDWLKTKNFYEQAKKSNLKGNAIEGGTNAFGLGMTGAAIGATFGPLGALIGAVGGALASLVGSALKTSNELDAITVEMNRNKQLLIQAAFQIPKQFNLLSEDREIEHILSNPIDNKDQIAEDAKYYREAAEEAFDEASEQIKIIDELTPKYNNYIAHKNKYGEKKGILNNPSFKEMESFLTKDEKDRLISEGNKEMLETTSTLGFKVSSLYPNKVQKLYEEKYKPKNLTDEETQRLTNAKNSYSELISEFDRFDKLAKTFDQVSKTTEAAIKAKEEQKRREEEEKLREEERLYQEELAEENAIKANTEVLYDNRNLRSQESQRRNYIDYVNDLVKDKGTSGALKELEKSDVFSKSAIESNLNTQQSRIDEIKKQIDELNKLFELGELSAEGISRLIQLEQLLENRQQQLDSDKKLYGNEELKKREEDEKKQEEEEQKRKKFNETRDKLYGLKDTYTNASSSQYLAQNLGSFSRYFGQTDPSLSLMKETNNTLKSILNRIENLNINNPSTYQ